MASVGCAGAMEFVVAHELLHSSQKGDRRMATLALMPLGYSHWVVSHIAHHAKVTDVHFPMQGSSWGDRQLRKLTAAISHRLGAGECLAVCCVPSRAGMTALRWGSVVVRLQFVLQ